MSAEQGMVVELPCARCGGAIEHIDGVVDARGGRRYFAAPCGHAVEDALAISAYERGNPPVMLERIDALALVSAERRRHPTDEGYTAEHDATLTGGELAWAAWAYLDAANPDADPHAGKAPPSMWPWDVSRWKPGPTKIRMLVKAAALICAEIDRRLARGEQP